MSETKGESVLPGSEHILRQAERLLRRAGVCEVRLPALESAGVECKSLWTGAYCSGPGLVEACRAATKLDPCGGQ
jgi:hypothetical protein